MGLFVWLEFLYGLIMAMIAIAFFQWFVFHILWALLGGSGDQKGFEPLPKAPPVCIG